MDTLFLPSDSLLKYCADPLDRDDSEQIFAYSSFAAKKLLQKHTKAYDKLKISVFEGIFSGSRSISELARKKYRGCSSGQLQKLTCCLFLEKLTEGKPLFFFPVTQDENGSCRLSKPERLRVRLDKETEGLEHVSARLERSAESKRSYPLLTMLAERQRGKLLLQIGGAVMQTSLKELAFVSRFNEETFFKNMSMSEFDCGRLGIEEKSHLSAFAALYAMTFFSLSFRDIYTVDEVFSFSEGGIRSKDAAKAEAARQLKEELKRLSDNDLALTLKKMGDRLLTIPLPEADARNFVVLAENYVYYIAAANIGEVFLKAAEAMWKRKAHEPVERAEMLCEYRYAKELCEEIYSMANEGVGDISKAHSFKKAEALQKKIEKAAETADEQM